MPEHFHLLIGEPERADPSVVIQALKLGVVRRVFPTPPHRDKPRALGLFEHSAAKHFWQRRFYDFNVWSAHKHREKLRYIHRNPVKRGLVESPDQWRWSSFRAYAFAEPGPIVVNDWSKVKMKVRAASSGSVRRAPLLAKNARNGAPSSFLCWRSGPPAKRRKTIPVSDVNKLLHKLRDEDFFHWEEKAHVCVDYPEVRITADLNGQHKQVLEGCSAPGKILALAEEIDTVSGTKSWVGNVGKELINRQKRLQPRAQETN